MHMTYVLAASSTIADISITQRYGDGDGGGGGGGNGNGHGSGSGSGSSSSSSSNNTFNYHDDRDTSSTGVALRPTSTSSAGHSLRASTPAYDPSTTNKSSITVSTNRHWLISFSPSPAFASPTSSPNCDSSEMVGNAARSHTLPRSPCSTCPQGRILSSSYFPDLTTDRV
jgi:hypothetical protein